MIGLSNNINQSNYNFCREVEAVWKRAGRAVEDNNKTKAADLIEKGKRLTRKRMKCFRLADKEGWDVALAFLSDDMASDDDEAKRLKTARKETKAKREQRDNARDRPNRQRREGRFSRGEQPRGPRSPSREQNDYGRYRDNAGFDTGNRGYSTRRPENTCWRCGRIGHLSFQCRV